jgi:hypothetical protein
LHHPGKSEAGQHRRLRPNVLAVVGVEDELLLADLEQLHLQICLKCALVRVQHAPSPPGRMPQHSVQQPASAPLALNLAFRTLPPPCGTKSAVVAQLQPTAERQPMATFVRRTEFQDQARIDALIAEENETLVKRFGHFDVTTLIETSLLCISAVDENGDVVGFAAFHDHPSGRVGVTAADWPLWFHTFFAHPHLGPANVAWLSYFVCDPTVHAEVAENVLRSAFTTMPEVDAVLLSLPADVNLFMPLKDTFEELTPKVLSQSQRRTPLAAPVPGCGWRAPERQFRRRASHPLLPVLHSPPTSTGNFPPDPHRCRLTLRFRTE